MPRVARFADEILEAVDHRRERAVLVADRSRAARRIASAGTLLSTVDTSTGMVVSLQHVAASASRAIMALSAAPSVRRHEDEIAAARFRGTRGSPRAAGRSDRRERIVRNARGARDDLGLGQERARLARHVLVERGRRHHALERADARRAVVGLGVEERHLRAERRGRGCTAWFTVSTDKLRIVDRYEQMAIHVVSRFLCVLPERLDARVDVSIVGEAAVFPTVSV